jgi:hypothetical protein
VQHRKGDWISDVKSNKKPRQIGELQKRPFVECSSLPSCRLHARLEGRRLPGYGQGRELEIGNATSAILISLLQTLVDMGVVSNTEVRALLAKAASDLGPHEYTAPVKGAIGVILDDVLPKFPENGGD